MQGAGTLYSAQAHQMPLPWHDQDGQHKVRHKRVWCAYGQRMHRQTEKIYFTYDDNGLFEGKDAQWDISTGGDRVERGFIKLGMMGYIPGWKIVNVLESEKMVNVRNFKDIYRVRKYTKKDGVMCEEPIIEKVPMTALELEPYLNSYYKV